MKIVKLTEGILSVLTGTFSPNIHGASGYVEVENATITYQEDGSLFPFYKLIAGQYVEDNSLYLVQVTEEKKLEFKAARDIAAQGTIQLTTSLGNTFVVDLHERNRSTMHQAYDNAVNAGIPLTDTVIWKMGDNAYADISYAEIAEVGAFMGVFISEQFAHEANKLQEIAACSDNTTCVANVTW